jgi:imidazolonepropionase-like amidohydrolase
MIIKNAMLIDGISEFIKENQMIIIEDDRILFVGEYDADTYEDTINKGHKTVNINGKTIMPGMIDTHIHLCMNGEIDGFKTTLIEPVTLLAIKAAQRAKKYIKAGFTTIRCLGEKGSVDIAVKKAIEEGIIDGPRLIASGKCITVTGGHGDVFPHQLDLDLMAEITNGPIGVRTAVRKQIKDGADNIKFMSSGGGMTPGPPEPPRMTIDEMAAGTQIAAFFNKTTAAHCIGAESIKNALKAGVGSIEHGTFLDDEGIELLIKNNAYLVPTLSAFKTIKYGKDSGVAEDLFQKVKYFEEVHTKNLKKAIKAGVKIIMGTDAGTPFNYHGDNAYELECLVKNGLSPMEAIKCTTKSAAEALRLHEVGSIEAGKIADLIVVNGNPLQDITLLQNKDQIEIVIKEGRLLKK